MYPLRYLAVCLALCISPVSCGYLKEETFETKTAASVANATLLTVEAAQTSAVAVYRAEQFDVIAQAREEGWTQDRAKTELQVIRKKWQPVWQVFKCIRETQQGLTEALAFYEAAKQAGKDPNLPNLLRLASELQSLQGELAQILASVRKAP